MSSLDDFAHLRIPLENILSATNKFSGENFYREDAFVKDYYGELLWSGELIIIFARRLNKEWVDGEQQFWMEVSMLSNLKHKNLVSLVGFCDENDEKIIITRRDTWESLSYQLRNSALLTWVPRLKICVNTAQALSYIHYDVSRDFSVIHRNIDSSSIRLNNDGEPKLGDFIRSMKIKASERHNSFNTDKVWSTDGYTDPTYIETKSVNHKSDIYSFGILMFELLCDRKAVIEDDQDNKYLALVAVAHYREKKLYEIIEWNLWKEMDSQSLNIFAEIAYDYLNEERSERPNIDEIVTRLEKALELQLEHHNAISSLKDDLAHLKIPLEKCGTYDLPGISNIYHRGKISWWSGDLIGINALKFDDEREFWMEVSKLSSLKHKNLASFLGFCDEKIIITKRETRGLLSDYLSNPMMLTWVRRLEISVGIAQALSYIHYDESRDFSIIHRHINSWIELNDDWEPKLNNFKYSMKIQTTQRHHSFHTSMCLYAVGYEDPTYIKTRSVNHKSDMYSFGIVLIELLCGTKVEYGNRLAPPFITHYREKKLDKIIDQDLWLQMDLHSLNMFAEIVYECLDEEQSRRPNINDIVPRLEKALELARENRQIHSSPNHLARLRIPLEDVLSATKGSLSWCGEENDGNFEGRFGCIYKGQLSWCGELINITFRKLINKERDEKEQQFWTEISMLSSLKHKNLDSVVGFCNEVGAETIIYKRKFRGRLGNYLSNPMLLTWMKRLEVSVGIAHALSYIHYDEPRDFSVIHGNISSYTILLNDDWEPILSEFQYSMKIKASERHHAFHTDSIWSAKGYIDPTYLETGNLNHKSDIYSFGMALFELLCGRESRINSLDNKYLAPVASFHYREKILDEIIDPDLLKQMDRQSLNTFAETAYECLSEEQSKRPDMDQIVTRLEKALKLQLECENAEHSLVVEKVGETSSSHGKGSKIYFISTGIESHLSKKTMSSFEYSSYSHGFGDIRFATNDFHPSRIIGGKTNGCVYQGWINHSGNFVQIAARRIHHKYQKDESEKFKMKVWMLSTLKHKNLASFIGFCYEGDEQIIIYKIWRYKIFLCV